jgi:tRNA G37 N-methylase Trm5
MQYKQLPVIYIGIGNVSILIDKCGGATSIVASDGDDDTITLLNENITLVNSNVIARKLYWGDNDAFLKEYPSKFDVLIGADIIYEDEQVAPLMDTAYEMMKLEGVFYLAYARRNIPIDNVLLVATNIGFKWEVIDAGDGQEPVYKFTRS